MNNHQKQNVSGKVIYNGSRSKKYSNDKVNVFASLLAKREEFVIELSKLDKEINKLKEVCKRPKGFVSEHYVTVRVGRSGSPISVEPSAILKTLEDKRDGIQGKIDDIDTVCENAVSLNIPEHMTKW